MSERENEGFGESPERASASPVTPDRPEREGLPPGFRMRADAHYVDVITARRSEPPRSRGASEWDTDLDPVFPTESRDAARSSAFDHLAEDLATIQGAAAMLAGEGSPLVKRVSLDLIHMHASRAAWRLRAERLLSGALRADRRGRRLGALLTEVQERLAPFGRLSGVGLQVHASDWEAVVSVDQEILGTGLTGAVLATLGLVRSDEWAAVRILAVAEGDELQTIDVAQEEVALPESLARRFFDGSNIDRPGGWAASLGAASAKAAARLHGGDATLIPGERRGTTIRLTF